MIKNGNIYIADEGSLIIRKENNFIMGDRIYLSASDSIKNYEQKIFTREKIKSFWESIGEIGFNNSNTDS